MERYHVCEPEKKYLNFSIQMWFYRTKTREIHNESQQKIGKYPYQPWNRATSCKESYTLIPSYTKAIELA